jgi:hypothetical protein
MKKIAVSFVLCLLASVAVFADDLVVDPLFEDIDGHDYDYAIEYVANRGIVEGYDDGTYRPDNLINRAEFTKIIVEALYDEEDYEEFDLPDEVGSYEHADCFFDIPVDQWYEKYVCFAKSQGIIGGYPGGDFQPGSEINYIEALKVVLRAYESVGLIEELGSEEDAKYWYGPYSDYVYDDYVVKKEIEATGGFVAIPYLALHGYVALDEEITRAETAVIISWIMLMTQ